ncbi:MAG: hypothetical protein LKJ88_04000 [Bacilli bacterium]|jgi:hypothetical protein|nr:hypothetical protein [Bacilli bacterium]
MAKSVISQSDELAKLQRKLKRKNLSESFLVSFLVLAIWFIYVLLAAFGKGYYGLKAPFGTWTALANWPYPSLTGRLFDFSLQANVLRLIIIIGVVVLSAAAGLIFGLINIHKLDKSFRQQFMKMLVEEAKINGLVIDYSSSVNNPEEGIDLLNISSAAPKAFYQFSTPLLSWEGKDYSYQREGVNREGLMVLTDLSKARSHAFIQLRTFGEPTIKQYEGLTIRKYGFGDLPGLAPFVCFTTLGQDIYLVIDKKTAQALSSFYKFVRCDLILTVIGDKMTIFLDGFKLSLTKPLSADLPSQILEQEAEALVAIHQSITALANAFSGEISFAPEEKGNGILSY